MRKIILILAVLLFAVPALASVNITCTKTAEPNNTILISYEVVGEPNKVRAFALDITVDKGAVITDVNDDVSAYYTIYPGSIVIADGEISDAGQAVADYNDYTPDTKLGIGTSGVTVEMGALYSPTKDNSPNSPPLSGNLLKVSVGGVTHCCKLSIVENAARGGVVLTKASLDPVVNAPGYSFIVDCLDYISPACSGGTPDTEYNDWIAWGRPACWCYCRQCRGDTDGKATFGNWVAIPDLNLLSATYNKTNLQLQGIPNGICGDLDHKATFGIRVAIPDLNIFAAYYGKPVGVIPRCNLPTVITGPYNFWVIPAGSSCP